MWLTANVCVAQGFRYVIPPIAVILLYDWQVSRHSCSKDYKDMYAALQLIQISITSFYNIPAIYSNFALIAGVTHRVGELIEVLEELQTNSQQAGLIGAVEGSPRPNGASTAAAISPLQLLYYSHQAFQCVALSISQHIPHRSYQIQCAQSASVTMTTRCTCCSTHCLRCLTLCDNLAVPDGLTVPDGPQIRPDNLSLEKGI